MPSFLQKENTYSILLGLLSNNLHRKHRFNRLVLDLEVLIFNVFVLEKTVKQIGEDSEMKAILDKWTDQTKVQLHDLFMHYPHWAKGIQNSFMAKVLSHSSLSFV